MRGIRPRHLVFEEYRVREWRVESAFRLRRGKLKERFPQVKLQANNLLSSGRSAPAQSSSATRAADAPVGQGMPRWPSKLGVA